MATNPSRIPEAFIQEVLSRIDIVDIVNPRVTLKKTGSNYAACCPFHHEKTPSFSVSQVKQFYHCFGCGAHGDAIAFITHYDGLNFIEALTQLATMVGLSVPTDPTREKAGSELAPLYQLMAKASEYYQQQLVKHPLGQSAINYLKNRGVTGQIAKAYGIGFAPPGWSHLLDALGATEKDVDELGKAGMLVKSDKGKIYDRFRNRIMIPIRDRKGRVIGFGGRVLDDSLPKYLNSPETPLFHKGHCLFGLHEALKQPVPLSRAILVEGYMDVIALEQHHIHGALATLGTAVGEYQLKLLFKYCNNVVFCFDGDRAGREAALKTQRVLLPLMEDGIEVKFVFLPEGADPDSYLHTQGAAAFEAVLGRGVPFSEYFFRTIQMQVEPRSIDAKARFAKLAKPQLALLPQGLFREMMYNKLSEIIQIERNVIDGKPAAKNYKKEYTPYVPYKKMPLSKPSNVISPAKLAALLLIREPGFIALLEDEQALFSLKGEDVGLLITVIELLRRSPNLTHRELTKALAERDSAWQDLESLNPAMLIVSDLGLKQEFLGAVQRLQAMLKRQKSSFLLEKAKNEELSEAEKLELKKLLN